MNIMIREIILILLMVAVLHPYLFYPLTLIFIQMLRSPKRKRCSASDVPSVSVLIPMYNEEANVDAKINNCLSLTYPKEKIEFVIGSDGSTDRTNELLRQYEHHPHIHVYYFPRQGKSMLLNELVKHANGEILFLTDADTIVGKDAVTSGVGYFTDAGIGGVGGNIHFTSVSGRVRESMYWKFDKFLRSAESRIKSTIVVSGSVFLLRRDLYKPLPGHIGVADDFTLPLSIIEAGKNVIFAEDVHAQTLEAGTVRDEFRRRVRVAMLNYQSLLYHRRLLLPHYGFISYALLSHKLLRWLVPVFLCLLFCASCFTFRENVFTQTLFFLQIVFYGSAAIGGMLMKLGIESTPFYYPFYFLVVNSALLVGMVKMFFHTHAGVWEASR